MSYSEGGPSNGQIYKLPIDTGLNHSGSIPIWLGDLPVQLQGLTLCGSVTVGRQNWIFLKFLKHFWPESEPCIQATIKDMDFIFPVPALRSITYPPCKYESMDMQSWSTVVCQTWGQFRWNLVISCQNVVFWMGSIKRADLQTAYRYRAESFRVDSNMIGRSTCAVTRSDLIRVSHSWTPKLNILKIIKHFWPASEHCRQATISIWTLYFLRVP